MSRWSPRRALLSVSDKHGIVELARALHDLNVEILSTGGTYRVLREAGVPAREVSDVTGFPEIMDGRVKTLHPRIHGGLLGRSGIDDAVMSEHGIAPIDLLVVNLYPFEQTVLRPGCTREQAIEQIDVGGPAMLRAAAKNHARVAVVTDPDDYALILAQARLGELTPAVREALAAKAFALTARYDAAIAGHLGALTLAAPTVQPLLPERLHLHLWRAQALRYGENPHQQAALYRQTPAPAPGTLGGARMVQGKELSYNNFADADAAWSCVRALGHQSACVIVKHANPCGAAVAASPLEAYRAAYATDPTSAFGGVIAFNTPLTAALVRAILDQQFVEVVIAPHVEAEARTELVRKPNVRVLDVGPGSDEPSRSLELKCISGGVLVQSTDIDTVSSSSCRVAGARSPDERERADLMFAWRVAMHVKSNAIVYVRDGRTLGVGAGQMSRIDSARIAASKAAEAGLSLRDAVMASDAFFPFRDGIDEAARHGIRAVIHPGGSVRDAEVIGAADEHGMAMLLTGVRHFRH